MTTGETGNYRQQPTHKRIIDGMRRLMTPSGALRLTALGAATLAAKQAAELSTASVASANPNSRIRCNTHSGNFNTIICGRTERQAAALCAHLTTDVNQLDLKIKGSYAGGSHSKYPVNFRLSDPIACDPAGQERIIVEQRLQDGSSGTPTVHGSVVRFTEHGYKETGDNDIQRKRVTLDAPYDCSDLLPGSLVAPVVLVEFVPTAGWTHAGPTLTLVQGPMESIC